MLKSHHPKSRPQVIPSRPSFRKGLQAHAGPLNALKVADGPFRTAVFRDVVVETEEGVLRFRRKNDRQTHAVRAFCPRLRLRIAAKTVSAGTALPGSASSSSYA